MPSSGWPATTRCGSSYRIPACASPSAISRSTPRCLGCATCCRNSTFRADTSCPAARRRSGQGGASATVIEISLSANARESAFMPKADGEKQRSYLNRTVSSACPADSNSIAACWVSINWRRVVVSLTDNDKTTRLQLIDTQHAAIEFESAGQAELTVRFRYDRCFSPSALGINADSRALALRLISMTVAEAPP